MNRILAALLVSSLGACAPRGEVASPPPPSSAKPWDKIEFQANSWGVPKAGWSVDDLGIVTWREYKPLGDTVFAGYSTTYHVATGDTARMPQLAKTLAGIPYPAPDHRECRPYVNDLPYGTVRFTRGSETREIAWNVGCQSAEYATMMGKIFAADELVEGWGKAAPVSYTEEHRVPE